MGHATVVVCLALLLGACGGTTKSDQTGLRIFDPTGRVRIEVTSAGIVRSSVRAAQIHGSAVVAVAFTKDGASKFCRLTRALARRGATLHKQQRLAVAINGRVRRVFVDYEATPSGSCGRPGIEISVRDFAAALELERQIRDGTTSE